MSTEILFALLLILLLCTLAVLLWYWKSRGEELGGRVNPDVDFDLLSGGTDCPLCGEHLPRGNRVHSVLYPGKEFDLMRIYGCRHCWAGHPSPAPDEVVHKRRCPYCGDNVPGEGYVMAQVYKKPYRKTHVHVYGCTVCKPGRG